MCLLQKGLIVYWLKLSGDYLIAMAPYSSLTQKLPKNLTEKIKERPKIRLEMGHIT